MTINLTPREQEIVNYLRILKQSKQELEEIAHTKAKSAALHRAKLEQAEMLDGIISTISGILRKEN